MIFSSIPFLYYFLPCVLLVYFLMPGRGKNAVLLLFSLVFYAWGEPKYVLVMLLSILLGYVIFAVGVAIGFLLLQLLSKKEISPWALGPRLRGQL